MLQSLTRAHACADLRMRSMTYIASVHRVLLRQPILWCYMKRPLATVNGTIKAEIEPITSIGKVTVMESRFLFISTVLFFCVQQGRSQL